jgi:murein hydrolase activator
MSSIPANIQTARLHIGLFCLLLLLANGTWGDEKTEMEQLQKDIQALQKELQQVQGTRSNLQKELQKSESAIGDLQKKADVIQKNLKEQNQELQKLNNERSSLEQQQRQQQEQIAAQILAAHKLGKQSEAKVLLNQEAPDKVARIMAYHGYFMQAHNTKLLSFLETITRIDALAPAIEKKTLALSQLQAQLNQERLVLKTAQSKRQTALAKVNQVVKSKHQELQQLNEDRTKLQNLLNRVTRSVAQTSGANSPAYVPLPNGGAKFSTRKGRLPWPTQGTLIHRFGSARIAGQMNWNGVVIAAAMGNPVIAVHHGRIVFADYFGGHGLLIIVDHGEGYMSLYAHNQHLLKKAGDPVSAGEVIAKAGNSGGQTNSGVYFEIRHQGKPTDPSNWLARS